jgi:hypothetical protein
VSVGLVVVIVAMLLSSTAPSLASPVTNGLGAGIFSFSGPSNFSISLQDAGNYYLAAASDGGVVGLRIDRNGTLVADTNTTTSRADLLTLLQGNYTVHASGTGRCALGIDFTGPGMRSFPVSEPIVAFVSPPPANMIVHIQIGGASSVQLGVYDDTLHSVWNGSISASGDVGVDFGRIESFAVLAVGSSGTMGATFSLSWGAAPPPDLTLLYVASVAVPVAVAAAVLLILHYRRHPGRP